MVSGQSLGPTCQPRLRSKEARQVALRRSPAHCSLLIARYSIPTLHQRQNSRWKGVTKEQNEAGKLIAKVDERIRKAREAEEC